MAEFLKKFSKVTVFIISTIIFWLVFPAVYLLVTPFFLYRWLIKCAAKLYHPEWVGIMNVRDVFISEDMNNEKGLESTISLIFIIKGIPDYAQLRDGFMKKVLLQRDVRGMSAYVKFKYYYEDWWGFPFWKREEDFNLERHIRPCEETLGRKEVKEEEFMDLMSPITTKRFQPGMSPWEMLIVENYIPTSVPDDTIVKGTKEYFQNPRSGLNNNNNNEEDLRKEKRFAIIFRFHHTLCDGFSMAKIVVENFGGQPKENTPKAPRKRLSLWQSFLLLLDCFVQVGYSHLKILIWDYDYNKWHVSPWTLTGQWHTFVTDPIPFELARATSKKVGVTTTSVLFGAVGGGIRRYWKRTGKTGNDIPKLMRGLFALPMRGHPYDGLVNHWTFANVPLPLRNPDGIKRLRKINANFEALKKSAVPGMVWLFSPFYMAVPRWLINIWGANRMTTVTLSNFPGPREPIKMFDIWPIEDTWYWLPRLRGNASVHVACLTYKGSIRITLAADKCVLPDKEDAKALTSCIQEEMYSFQDLSSPKELQIEMEL